MDPTNFHSSFKIIGHMPVVITYMSIAAKRYIHAEYVSRANITHDLNHASVDFCNMLGYG